VPVSSCFRRVTEAALTEGFGHSPGVLDAKCCSLQSRPSVHGEKPCPTRGDPVTQNTADLKV